MDCIKSADNDTPFYLPRRPLAKNHAQANPLDRR
jgi:hypothetical protein